MPFDTRVTICTLDTYWRPDRRSGGGKIEETGKPVGAGKPVMVYISTAPVAPKSLDQDAYA
ncbi:MAG: hypothetical protein AAGF88_09605 [Pseudomonadota bacterium]